MPPRNLFLAVVAFAAFPALADPLPDKKETFGAVVAPAALPSGANAVYVYVGAPEVGGGYRQGVERLELEARVSLDYLSLSFAAEVGARFPVLRDGLVELAPTLGFGLVYDTGARFYDRANFQFIGLRPRLGAIASLNLADTVRGILAVDVPWAFALAGGFRVTPLVGGGAELYLSEDMSALVLGQIGVDAIKEQGAVSQARVGWKLQLGVGFRLF